ncbi:DUF1028 domain-containing protein [Pelagibacterium lentulum]|uniref:Pilus assembly protein n=1 Tax=Pelagibacterium lentulum TaxID=2029865 RepID=A0A916VV94_9HYPH|nr:DUF1028 domain-containing protein [Pelagibacterium lentulum]GGA39547.1 pilus assembly protein [Pelagibacterium lentulum]
MTYSIIARDKISGAFGVATATGGPAVGALVPHARAGLGALATQGYTNPFYAYDGLAMLAQGKAAQAIVDSLTQADAGREKRQLIVIDTEGQCAGWTGKALSPNAGMILGDGFAIAGNLLTAENVLAAMEAGFLARPADALADRMMAAMQSGFQAGGDKRGTFSAALKVVTDQLYPAIDIRIDRSETAIGDLTHLLDEVRNGDYGDFVAGLPRR